VGLRILQWEAGREYFHEQHADAAARLQPHRLGREHGIERLETLLQVRAANGPAS
jgi:hypothetical protein